MLVLVLIVAVSAGVGAVLLVHQAQHRLIHTEIQETQVRYAAEAGIHWAMARLQQTPDWRPIRHPQTLPAGFTAEITVEPFGGFLLILSTVLHRRQEVTIRALVGAVAPEAFDHALWAWDAQGGVQATGSTFITGPVRIGPRGLQGKPLKGRRFTGHLTTQVRTSATVRPPAFNPEAFDDLLDACAAQVREVGSERVQEPAAPSTAPHLPSQNTRYLIPGTAYLSEQDSVLFHAPITVVATGNLYLEGTLHFQPGSQFIAGDTLVVRGTVTGTQGLFYGKNLLVVGGQVQASGQYASERRIRISEEARLAYPSLVYVAGVTTEAPTDGIEVQDQAQVDGVLIHPPRTKPPRPPHASVYVGKQAVVRGAIFNGWATELAGTLHGSLLTHQVVFYDAPTWYINWLRDARVDVTARPPDFAVPLGFSQRPHLEVLTWKVIHRRNPLPTP